MRCYIHWVWWFYVGSLDFRVVYCFLSILAIILLRERERERLADCFILIVLWLSLFCVFSSPCPGMVCNFDISRSYSLVFLTTGNDNQSLWTTVVCDLDLLRSAMVFYICSGKPNITRTGSQTFLSCRFIYCAKQTGANM